MDINKKNRSDLKSYFVKNSIPTESNFAELIDGMLNQKDDGIVKLSGDPLSIEAAGDLAGLQKVINFYAKFQDANPSWSLQLNPRTDPNTPATAKVGFCVADGQSVPRLFIDKTGNLGVGTITPQARLTVVGAANISDGNGWANANNKMASGSLTIGSIAASYGGGSNWTTNTAGLLLETQANTEIAVHDANTRIASFMYYEGDSINKITIGRSMGPTWGVTPVTIAGNLTVNAAITPSVGNSASNGVAFKNNVGGDTSDSAWIRYYARSAELMTLEIGTANDNTDHIAFMPSGNVGIGLNNPIAKLDIVQSVRTGTHPAAIKGLYVTGDFGADTDGVEFRHSNGTQGIGFGYNTIYAAGSYADQDLLLKAKGAGTVRLLGNVALGGFTVADADEWPKFTWYRDLANNWDEGLIKHASSRGFFGRTGFGIHLHSSRDWTFFSTGWDALFGIEGGTGNTKIKGNLTVNGAFMSSANVGIGVNNSVYSLDVGASKGIKLGLEGYGGGQLILKNNKDDNKIYLEAFSKDGTGSAAELLLTGKDANNVPRLSLLADNTYIDGDVIINGSITCDTTVLSSTNYTIELCGSAFESTEGNITFLKVNNISMGMTTIRGLNTVILNPDGTVKITASHDVYLNAGTWNTWATWVNANAAFGDVVAVASFDAINNAPRGGDAELLLTSMLADQAFTVSNTGQRSPYALLFMKGGAAVEAASPYKGTNAHLKRLSSALAPNPNEWRNARLINNWVNYGNGYNPAQYFKDNDGVIWLRGLVRSGVLQKTLFVLPDGCRPSYRQLHSVCVAESVLGRVDVTTDGQVVHVAGGVNNWISLDGIAFRVASKAVPIKAIPVRATISPSISVAKPGLAIE